MDRIEGRWPSRDPTKNSLWTEVPSSAQAWEDAADQSPQAEAQAGLLAPGWP